MTEVLRDQRRRIWAAAADQSLSGTGHEAHALVIG